MFILYAVCGLLVILAAVLLTGRGANLIAGYNTMSAADKARYDAPKLCRATAVLLLVLAFCLFGLASGWLPVYVFLGVAFLAVPGFLFYTNTQCYQRRASVGDVPEQDASFSADGTVSEEERRKRRKDLLVFSGISVLLVAVFAVVTVMLINGSQPPTYTIADGSLTITSQYGTRIPLADIRKIERLEVMPKLLAKTNGFDMDAIRKGRFRTADGDATLFVDLHVPPFLRLTTTNDVFILNGETPEKTEALYQDLTALMP